MYWRQWSSYALSAFACPAVATHLNSGFPKPLAPTGAASQSYQLPPVADLLRLRENHLYKYTARKAAKRHPRAVTVIPGPPTRR